MDGKFVPYVGESIYFYSVKLDECIEGKVEGFYTDDYSIIKVLQKLPDGYIRHIVPVHHAARTLEDLEILSIELRREKQNQILSKDIHAGKVVYLKEGGKLVSDDTGEPYKYQVIAVYTKQGKVKLVTDYGEEIGMYDILDLEITDLPPLFTMDNYSIGDKITLAEYENVYEGEIVNLHSSMAEIGNVKKLYPVDYRRKVPYYKIKLKDGISDRSSDILTTIKDYAEKE